MESTEEIKELVIARLQTLPEGKSISIGSEGKFSKQQLINHVQSGDEIGEKMISIEMGFLRDLKEGLFYGNENLTSYAS